MNVLIIGAGVAGCATALALSRSGHRVRVCERRTSDQTLGAGVVLWPNATFVMAQLGLLDDVRAVGRTPPAMNRYDASGASLGGWDIGQLDRAMGFPSVAIRRADLQAILTRALERAGVLVEERRAAVAIEGQGTVEFADGSRASADLIIGADGRMASVARRYVLGGEQPVYQGFINWVGTARVPRELLDNGAIRDFWGVGQRFGIVPVAADIAYWAGAVAAPTPPEGASRGDFKDELRRLFATWPSIITAVIEGSEAHAIRRLPLYDHEPVATWHRGTVLLIGDAAHAALPTSGQGACQALEDAWHLAARLPSDPRDLEPALAAFTALRLPKVRAQTFGARQFARSLFELDVQACKRRDEAARQADDRQTIAGIAQGWSAGLPLHAELA